MSIDWSEPELAFFALNFSLDESHSSLVRDSHLEQETNLPNRYPLAAHWRNS